MSITEEHAIRICETISNGYGEGFPLCPDTGKMISWSTWLQQQIEAPTPSPSEREKEMGKWLGMWLSWSRGHGFKVTEAATHQALAGLQEKTRALLSDTEGE